VGIAAELRGVPAGTRRRRLLESRLFTQSVAFTLASVLTLALSAVGKAVLASQMAPDAFGRYAFCTSFLVFTALFFEFGLFTPAARRIARADPGDRPAVIGAALSLFVPVGGIFCLAVFAMSFAVEPAFGIDAGEPLRVTSALAFTYAFSVAAAQIAQGADRVGAYSMAGGAGQAAYLGGLLVVLATLGHVGVGAALVINGGGLLVMMATFVVILRPRRSDTGRHLRAIVRDARRWGIQLYIGRVLSVGTYNMDVLMVAAFTNARQTGFYALATALAAAAGIPVQGLAAASFGRMSRGQPIERRWLLIAWTFGAAGILGMALLAPLVVDLALSPAYHRVAVLTIPLAMAGAVRGVTGIYNTYLSARGRGRQLRNCGLVLTASNVVLNFGLIPPFGAMGAAWASVAALVFNYLAHLHYYRQERRG
jgi:O-antigen/teichoic acid export membrane protein